MYGLCEVCPGIVYLEDIQAFFINIGFTSIEWYENKYITGDDRFRLFSYHEMNINPVLIEKNLNVLFIIYVLSF